MTERGDLGYEAAPNGPERLLDLADVGAVVRVGQLSYGGLADTQPVGKLHFGNALSAHSRVQRELGGNHGRYGDDLLTIRPPGWEQGMSHFSWTYPARAVARASSAHEQGFGPVSSRR